MIRSTENDEIMNFKLPHEHFAETLIKFINWLPKSLQKFAACAAIAGILWVSLVLPFQESAVETEVGGIVMPRPTQAFWGTLLLFAASVLANEYLTPKPKIEDARPSGDGDFKIPTATEGRPIPLLWGRARIDGPNVVWYGDIRQEPIRKKIKTGLWSSVTQTVGYENYVSWQQVLCRGPNVELKNLWIGDKLAWTGNLTSDESLAQIADVDFFGPDTGGWVGEVEFFTGGANQAVSDHLDTVGRQRVTTAATQTAPRYTGTCHLVIKGAGGNRGEAAYVGNSINIKNMSADVQRIPDLFPGQSSGHNAIGSDGDANPINVVYEYLTNSEWGMGRAASEIDTGSGSTFVSASNTMRTEVNGFSMLLDKELQGDEFLEELERHIDGVVYRNLRTKKWEIKLARADYVIDDQPLLDESNSTVLTYTQSGWEDTSNQIQVLYSKREDDYKESYALAQDMANALLQGDGTVTTGLVAPVQMRFPGCKTAALATNLAWRELRSQAYPLARATIRVDRDKWDITLGTVIAWTSTRYGFTKLPMRVTLIDYGTLEDNGITLTLVQDVFYFEQPSFGVAPAGIWVEPTVDLVAYPAADELILEAPRVIWPKADIFGFFGTPAAIVGRSYTWLGAVRQGNEYQFNVYTGSTTPPTRQGAAQDQFLEVGTLDAALSPGAQPASTFDITTTAASFIASLIDDDLPQETLGTQYQYLIMVGTEMMLISGATASGDTLTVTNVWRGVLDTTQEEHAINAKVWFLFTGMGLATNSSGAFLAANGPTDTSGTSGTLNIGLRMATFDDEFSGTIVTTSQTGTNRDKRPYPVAGPVFNTTNVLYGTASVEGTGSGNSLGIDISFWRRSFPEIGADYDEIAVMSEDDYYGDLDASTEYQVELRSDPDGDNDLVDSVTAWATGNAATNYTRNALLLLGDITRTLRLTIRTRHDYIDPVTGPLGGHDLLNLENQHEMVYDFVPTTTLAGTYLGATAVSPAETAIHTAASTGTYTVNLGASQATAVIQYELNNSGTWLTAVAATNTTGTFSATAGDDIRLRRTVNESPNPNFVEITFGGSTVAYGVFNN